MRTLKVVMLLAVFALVSNVAFAGLIMDVRAVGVSGGGIIADAKHVNNLTVGSVVTMQVFAELTGADSGYFLSGVWATIPETAISSGLHGTMSYVSGAGVGNIYNTNWVGADPTKTPTGIGTDVDMDDYAGNAFGAGWGGSGNGLAASPAIVLGQFNYTVTGVGATSASVTIVPDTDGYCQWNDALSGGGIIFSDSSNTSAGGAVTLNAIPEPSTLILLGMGCLALLAIRRKK